MRILSDNFLVDHICITCDKIDELKVVVFSHICYMPKCFHWGTLDHVRDSMKITSGLVHILQPNFFFLPMLDCSKPARIESELSYVTSQILKTKEKSLFQIIQFLGLTKNLHSSKYFL